MLKKIYANNRQKLTILVALLAGFSVLLSSQSLWAQEAEVNLSSTIIGNQEQPKVLYIVPWQSVNDSELENQTIRSQMDIIFGHIEKVELQRELSYTRHLEKVAKKKSK